MISFQQFSVYLIILQLFFTVLCKLTGLKPLGWGRFSKSQLNFLVDPSLGWFLMEVPNLLMALYFLSCKFQIDLFWLFIIHYVNRAIVYPLRMTSRRKMPVEIVAFAVMFTTCNSYLQGLAYIQGYKTHAVLKVLGVIIFSVGMLINIDSDQRLRNYKSKSDSYQIPRGGLLDYVSSANYFGQIVEWIGYAIACGSTYPSLFALFTLGFLTTQGIKRADFNLKNISNYPLDRWKVIPFLI